MTSPNPTIVFVPGSWHTSACFGPVRDALHSRGWKTEAVDNPTVGAEPPVKRLDDDANALRAVLERLAEQGDQIVLVVHSYGGMVGANAAKGLGYRQRQQQGLPGGIVMFMYMAAFVAPLGKSVKDMLGGGPLSWMNMQGDYTYALNPKETFYHDLSDEACQQAIAALKHQVSCVFTDIVTYEPWHDIECMYFFCDEDKALVPAIQGQFAALLGQNALHFHAQASHSVFLSQIDETVKGIELAAAEGKARADRLSN